jgi:N-acyl homoserine lactone hydrolase
MSSIPLTSGIRIHALQTGTVAIKERQRDGAGRPRSSFARVLSDRRWTEPLPILAWLIEHPEGLILVDTGETPRVSEPGYFTPWHPYYRLGVKEWVEPQDRVGAQIERLGFSPGDVRWLALTHFHTDHAGGIGDLPASEIIASKKDYHFSKGLLGQARGFLPQHWPAAFAPRLVDFGDGPFGPFTASTTLTSAGDVHLIPTPGHTPGHLSVAVEDGDTVFFLAGDASYTERLMLDGVVDGVSTDVAAGRASLARIQELAGCRPTVYLPTHDAAAPARLAGRQITTARRRSPTPR